MSLEVIKKYALSSVDAISGDLIGMSRDIHKNPEVGFQEFKACGWLTAFLESQGFRVERNVAQMATAFVATFSSGNGGPAVAMIAEYDALPGLGHGCGHNIIGVSAAGAAVAVKNAMEKFGIAGRVMVMGTPAEEGGGGKVAMVDYGAFEGIDAAMMVHPVPEPTVIGGRSRALNSFTIQYHGKASHASANLPVGPNALDAASIFFHAIACLRQYVADDVRMHGIITKGGEAPQIVPDYAEISFLVRSYSESTLSSVSDRVMDCAKAGALATGCKVTIDLKTGYKARLPNTVLAALFHENLARLGRQIPEGTLDTPGSTDFGDVSRVVPACNLYLAIAPNTVLAHSVELREAACSAEGDEGLIVAAKVMALSALDLYADQAKVDRAKDEFQSRRDQ